MKQLMPLIALLAICATAHAGVDPILEQLRLVNPSAMRRALADLEKKIGRAHV